MNSASGHARSIREVDNYPLTVRVAERVDDEWPYLRPLPAAQCSAGFAGAVPAAARGGGLRLSLAGIQRGFPAGSQLPRTPANSHLVQPRRTNSREFSGRPTRGNSRIEGTRPVRSGLRPPPSSRANLDREETRAGFLPSFRGFAGVGCNARRSGGAERAAFSGPVSSLDFRGERLRRPRRQAANTSTGLSLRLC